MIKEKLIWELSQEIIKTHGGIVDNLHLIEENEFDTEFKIRVYHGGGYCFDLTKERVFNPEDGEVFNDYNDIHNLQKDGFTYSFYSDWDGFKDITIDVAIKMLGEYAKI